MRADGRAIAKHRPVDDILPVDRMGDGFADADIVKRRLGIVHRKDRLALGRSDDDGKPRIGRELCQGFGGGEIREGIHIARHHRGKGRVGIGNEAKRRRLQRHGCAPVGVVAHQIDAVTLDPVGEPERAGADRVRGVGLGGFGRHDDRIAPGHVEQKGAIGAIERDAQGQVIHRLGADDIGEQRALGIGRSLGTRAVERKHRIRRRQRAAVMKGHTGMQGKGIDGAICRDFP